MADPFCHSCGTRLGAMPSRCSDCSALFCSLIHLNEHTELGTCPEHADGDYPPWATTLLEQRDAAIAERDRLRAEVLAFESSADRFSYDDCDPDCDCGGHTGPRSCGCHVTGAEARAWIRELEAELASARPVVEAAKALVADWAANRSTHGGRLKAAVAALPPTPRGDGGVEDTPTTEHRCYRERRIPGDSRVIEESMPCVLPSGHEGEDHLHPNGTPWRFGKNSGTYAMNATRTEVIRADG